MGRVNLSIPDELHERVNAELPGVNYSQVLRDALTPLLACTHDELACTRCTHVLERIAIVDGALERFYADAMWRLREQLAVGGTLEGFGAVLKHLAEGYGISGVAGVPLPRLSRSERRATLRARLEGLPPVVVAAARRRASA